MKRGMEWWRAGSTFPATPRCVAPSGERARPFWRAIGSRAGGASTSTRAPTGKAAAASNVDSAGAAANEAVNALHQRGEKLGILGERVAKMEQEAQEFHDMARKMREQAERNSKWFPF